MTDRLVRTSVVTLTALTILAVLLDVPALLRVPFVLVFAMLAPGLAMTRFIPTLIGVDRLAVAMAASLATNIVASLALVALNRWSGEPVLATLAALSLFFAVVPSELPWRAERQARERARNMQIRDRRRAQEKAYGHVMSEDIAERREGLVALSWLLEDDGRRDEAARLRSFARLAVPPQLQLGAPGVASDAALMQTHLRVRGEDPEMRRQGLFEIADLLDEEGQASEAAALRDLPLEP